MQIISLGLAIVLASRCVTAHSAGLRRGGGIIKATAASTPSILSAHKPEQEIRRRRDEEQVQQPPYLVMEAVQPDGQPDVIIPDNSGYDRLTWSFNADLPLLYEFYGDGTLLDSCQDCSAYSHDQYDLVETSTYHLQVTNAHDIVANLTGR